ncbi:MAG TPA: cyclic pyranopterin monophosphate synthase MoaC [Gammaproteobacteria bacterium]|nr:cyclic pyranopterin monophosphate synthase MoaC [Gammaproteobacteria bacterium]
MTKLTHFNRSGDAHMVDVGGKQESQREAVASGRIVVSANTLATIAGGENRKGDVLAVARLAGIMASKKTADLIPLCHPLALTAVEVELCLDSELSAVSCTATVRTTGRTGVEMEALTAVQVALLTVYDMCKAIDRGMTIEQVRLEQKRGGKSGNWVRE